MKRRQVIMVAAAAIILGLFWFTYIQSREPSYGGKSLSEWVLSLGRAGMAIAPAEDQKDAILQIGTNALPFLVEWITYPAPSPDFHLFGIPFAPPGKYTKAELAQGSLIAFDVMGPSAAPALLDLVLLVKETNQIVFQRVMTSIETLVRNLGTNAALVVPPLIQLMNSSPDSQVAGLAAIQLGKIGKRTQPDAIVAALVRATQSADKQVRYCAAYGLGEVGSFAQAGIPALVHELGDPDPWVRSAATNSLNKISPQVLGMKEPDHNL